jgi:hypothetical protein
MINNIKQPPIINLINFNIFLFFIIEGVEIFDSDDNDDDSEDDNKDNDLDVLLFVKVDSVKLDLSYVFEEFLLISIAIPLNLSPPSPI